MTAGGACASGLQLSLDLQRRNAALAWSRGRAVAALEWAVTQLNLSAAQACTGEHNAAHAHASEAVAILSAVSSERIAMIGALLGVGYFYQAVGLLGVHWADSSAGVRALAARGAASLLRRSSRELKRATNSVQLTGQPGRYSSLLHSKAEAAHHRLERKMRGPWASPEGYNSAELVVQHCHSLAPSSRTFI